MNRKDYIDSILKNLGRFEAEIRSYNDAGLYDYNVHAENALIPILDILFKTKLRNANEGGVRNFPAIDLYDNAGRIAFQITATTGNQKIQDSLSGFFKHGLEKNFNTLYIIVLGTKLSRYNAKTPKTQISYDFKFDPAQHVIDFRNLRQRVADLLDIQELAKLATICEQEFFDHPQSVKANAKTKQIFSATAILTSFEAASLQLSEYANIFEGLQESHISRQETNSIINWITTPLNENQEPVHLLVGDPGSGKSVILRDCCEQLSHDGWVVLAFKADCYRAGSLRQLYERAELPQPLEDAVHSLIEKGSRVTVLIDQIDAVSQSVVSERDSIDTYGQLIHRLKKIDGVRIVVSIRRFELEYDGEFAAYRSKYGRTNVSPLSREQVKAVFSQLGINELRLSNSLFEQLRAYPENSPVAFQRMMAQTRCSKAR